MKIGDVVRSPNTGNNGIICRMRMHYPDSSDIMIRIAEIVWSTGQKSWSPVDELQILSSDSLNSNNLRTDS
jgi:hypothetical protein